MKNFLLLTSALCRIRIALTNALILICHFTPYILHAQHYTRTDTIPVYANGDTLKFPWVGGHNYCQFSDIDINLDGKKDLFVFDRTGNKITTYINKGTPDTVAYLDSTSTYASKFPPLEQWALCIDYNCDGKEDIFTASIFPSGIRVYKNTSTANNLQFMLVKTYLKDISGNFIPANSIGLPAMVDMDNDGDLDIVTYNAGSFTASYYINQSIDLYTNCDSLVFTLAPGCWGHFTETASGCSVALISCKVTPTLKGENKDSLSSPFRDGADNGSSCLLCLDMDADGDKELLLGQSNCCNNMLLTNGGSSSSANMTSFTTDFPSSINKVNVRDNPCGYFVDVNNDLKRDMLVSPSIQNVSVNNESIWYYENTGADNAPVFSRKTRSFLQEDMIDAGSGADPVFFDYDNDGLTDLLISNYVLSYDSCTAAYSYGVFAYRNTGTPSSPKFILTTADYANLSSALPNTTNKHLTFGDADGDGDDDMFVGDYNGNIHYFQNTAPLGNPANFVLTFPVNYNDDAGNTIDVGNHSTPQLADADRDGDLDLIIGERSGNLNYYENIGTPTAPSYSLVTNNFGGVDVMKPCCTGYSVPFLYDKGGKYYLLVGSEADRRIGHETGWIWLYDNIDGNLAGNFNRADSMYQNIWEGINMTVNGKDINNDGRMDLVIGNYCGGVAIYLGDTLTTGIAESHSEEFDFSIYPNPTEGKFQVSSPKFQVSSLEIYNVFGEIIFSSTIQPYNRSAIDVVLPSGLGQGIYFCKPSWENFSKTKKLILIK